MKRMILSVIVLSMALALRGEQLIAHWDFTIGDINSRVGGFKGILRGTTRIGGNEKDGKYLSIGMSPKEKPEGLAMAEIYPQLSPSGGFRLEARFRVREQTSTLPNLMLWDSKYLFGGNHQNMHHGFSLYLLRKSEERFQPIAWIGCGTHSEMFRGGEVVLEERKPYVLSFEYDGIRKFSFKFDGQLNAAGEAGRGGAMSPAVRPAVIGDRFGSHFFHFDGDIFELKLYASNKE